MGIGQMVTDEESVTIETFPINTLSACAILFFAKPLLCSFMTSAENLGWSGCYIFTKADAEQLKQNKRSNNHPLQRSMNFPPCGYQFSNFSYCKLA